MFTLNPWQKLALMGIRFDTDPDPEPKPKDPDPKPDDPKPTPKPEDEKKFTQADLDRAIAARLARKDKDPKPEDPKPAPKGDEPKVLTDEDVNKRIEEALAAKDKELAIERAGDAVDKALEGRRFPASLVRNLDVEQFVKDGKVDTAAINTWVEKETTKDDRTPRRDPSQGQRGTGDGGSVQAGRDLFESRHNKSKKQ